MNPEGPAPISAVGDALAPLAVHVAVSVGLAALLFLLGRRWSPPRTAILAAIVVVNLGQWAVWAAGRSTTIEDAQRSLATSW